MKKKYVKPEMEIMQMETSDLLVGSSDDWGGHGHGNGHGHETACEHGAHKWFCDD